MQSYDVREIHKPENFDATDPWTDNLAAIWTKTNILFNRYCTFKYGFKQHPVMVLVRFVGQITMPKFMEEFTGSAQTTSWESTSPTIKAKTHTLYSYNVPILSDFSKLKVFTVLVL